MVAMVWSTIDTRAERQGVLLDRDGVINRELSDGVRYVDEFEFLPGALRGIALLNRPGIAIAVVSNQANLGRGLLTQENLQAIHVRMLSEIEDAGGRIDRILVCPHRPEEHCSCRKPAPGLLLAAADHLRVGIETTYMVGDHPRDIAAAMHAGCRAVFVTGQETSTPLPPERPETFFVASDLLGASQLIIEQM